MKTKDILFIGGPKTVQGVDRIDDDLVSILTADGLYDRKAVVVWPTEDFLKFPADFQGIPGTDKLQGNFLKTIFQF